MARSRGLVVEAEVVGSNPGTVYWMDVSVASYYIKEKLKIKVAKWDTPKKYLKKKTMSVGKSHEKF